jgi:hypothetical protein
MVAKEPCRHLYNVQADKIAANDGRRRTRPRNVHTTASDDSASAAVGDDSAAAAGDDSAAAGDRDTARGLMTMPQPN